MDIIHPYWPWMVDCYGNLFPDFVGKMENIEEDWTKLQEICPLKLPEIKHLNETKHKDYRSYHNEKTIKIVRRLYSEDLQLFGYGD